MPLGEIFTEQGITTYQCSECSYRHQYEEDAHNCCVWYECEHCGREHETERSMERCCSYSCRHCGEFHDNEEDANYCCEPETEPDYAYSTAYPKEILDAEVEKLIYIPEIPGRPVRMSSVEQELCSGGAAVAQMLHDLGVSPYNTIQNYSRDTHPATLVVKEDSSLPPGGGEVVYSRFFLNDPIEYGKLSKSLACVRKMKNEGLVTTTTAAGTHIHVSAVDAQQAQIFGPAQMAALYEISSFAEEVLFRIGAAGWDKHRGDGSAMRLLKFDKLSAGKIAREARRERHFSLNFQRLLTAAQNCVCGACIAGDWMDCECGALEGGTIEWRVFNATTNPKTLHAWILLAHGLTAASFNHTLGTLEPNGWGEAHVECHPWVFGWILNNCPFLDEEKQIIVDCARRAPGLEIDWENFTATHGGWGQLEIPEPPVIERPVDPYEEAARQAQQRMQERRALRAQRIRTTQNITFNTNEWATAPGETISPNLQAFITAQLAEPIDYLPIEEHEVEMEPEDRPF